MTSRGSLSRIAIVGGPRTGKTTLALQINARANHTDDLMRLGWSEASAMAATWFDVPGPICVEGTAVARALRKWLKANPTGKPCDIVILLREPREALTAGQKSMAKGVDTVWSEIAGELAARGVEIRTMAKS